MNLRKGFTLIELLVVIVIVAVLASFAMSAVARSRVSTMQAQCSSNMRQIGSAMNFYAVDHDNEFPQSAHTDEQESWVYTLAPYVGNVDAIRICPADPRGDERLRAKGTSYVLNEFIVVPLTDPFGRVKESFLNRNSITDPARTITVFIGADGLDVGVSADHTHSRNWKKWRSVLADIQPDRFRVGVPHPDRIEGTANYLFADGHVESRPAEWLKKEIDAKRNPARPPQ